MNRKVELTKSLEEAIERKRFPRGIALDDLLKHAQKNKVLFYLLKRINHLPAPLVPLKNSLETKSGRILKIIQAVSEALEERGIKYCIFKTLRPVPYIPPDMDVLIFHEDDMDRAAEIIKKKLRGRVYSIANFDRSLYIERDDFYIDLYDEIHVADFTYISKNHLKAHLMKTKVNGKSVKVLEPEYELISLVGHAIFKEQVVTLLDRYSVYLLLSNSDMNSLARGLKRTHMQFPFGLFMSATQKSQSFPITIGSLNLSKQLLLKIFGDSSARKTFPHLISKLSKKQKIKDAVDHLTRETY